MGSPEAITNAIIAKKQKILGHNKHFSQNSMSVQFCVRVVYKEGTNSFGEEIQARGI
jgi:hypothetical protein